MINSENNINIQKLLSFIEYSIIATDKDFLKWDYFYNLINELEFNLPLRKYLNSWDSDSLYSNKIYSKRTHLKNKIIIENSYYSQYNKGYIYMFLYSNDNLKLAIQNNTNSNIIELGENENLKKNIQGQLNNLYKHIENRLNNANAFLEGFIKDIKNRNL